MIRSTFQRSVWKQARSSDSPICNTDKFSCFMRPLSLRFLLLEYILNLVWGLDDLSSAFSLSLCAHFPMVSCKSSEAAVIAHEHIQHIFNIQHNIQMRFNLKRVSHSSRPNASTGCLWTHLKGFHSKTILSSSDWSPHSHARSPFVLSAEADRRSLSLSLGLQAPGGLTVGSVISIVNYSLWFQSPD